MRHFTLVAVGRKHESNIARAIEDFTERLCHYGTITWKLIPSTLGHMPQDRVKQLEAEAILKVITPKDLVILLDEDGRESTSTDFAKILANFISQDERLVFIIGGAYGVDSAVKRRANYVWSLSKLTFPHQLVRLVLVEQLYRACTITAGLPYHHQ